MARKPYHHAQPDDWYKANCTYRWYMLRELTSITTAIAWLGWTHFQHNPLMLLINIIAIVGSLLNSKTWFEAMPKAIRIQRGEKFVPDNLIIKGGWAAFAGVLVILLILVACLS